MRRKEQYLANHQSPVFIKSICIKSEQSDFGDIQLLATSGLFPNGKDSLVEKTLKKLITPYCSGIALS